MEQIKCQLIGFADNYCINAVNFHSVRFCELPSTVAPDHYRHGSEGGAAGRESVPPREAGPSQLTSTALALVRQMYEGHDFSAMPVLADALQDAGCDHDDLLDHFRGPRA